MKLHLGCLTLVALFTVVPASGRPVPSSDAPEIHAFNSVVQIDLSTMFNADVVVTEGDTTQDTLDQNDYAFPTQSVAERDDGDDPAGLPDDAFFPGDLEHPQVQLAWDNDEADDVDNAFQVTSDGSFSLNVPDRAYDRIDLFAVSTEGQSHLIVTVHYSDLSADVFEFDVADWFDDPAWNTYALIDGRDRVETDGGGYDDADAAAIFGVRVLVDSAKTVTSLDIDVDTPDDGILTLFGATGMNGTRGVLPADVPLAGSWALAALALVLGVAALVRMR